MSNRFSDPRPMTPQEIEAAAHADPNAHPLTREDLRRMSRTPRAKLIRRSLGLTQEEFAARYQIPIGTLRDWEQGRTEPDQPARAYLKIIACDPKGVRKTLGAMTENARRPRPRSSGGLARRNTSRQTPG